MNDKEWLTRFFKTSSDVGRKNHDRVVPDDELIDMCDTAHKTIRKRLGGVKVVFSIDGCRADNADINTRIDKVARDITALFPDIDGMVSARGLRECNGNRVGSLRDLIKNRSIDSGNHNGIRTTKYLLSLCGQSVLQFMPELGKIWTEKETSSKIEITIDTSVRAFMQLGSYGCDSGSCFVEGGGYWYSKYALAVMPDTFVMLVNAPNNQSEVEYLGRAFGILTGNTLSITNTYVKAPFYSSQLFAAAKTIASSLLNANREDLSAAENRLRFHAPVYMNNWGNITFTPYKMDMNDYVVVRNESDTSPKFAARCGLCGENIPKEHDAKVAYSPCLYCVRCASKMAKCQLTGTYTQHPLIVAVVDGETIKINSELVTGGMFVSCAVCSMVYHYSQINKQKTCPQCIKKNRHADSSSVKCVSGSSGTTDSDSQTAVLENAL